MTPYSIKTGQFCYSSPNLNLQDHFQRRQVAFFSSNSGNISLDQTQLNPYHIPTQQLNVQIGSNGYIPKNFKNNKSTIGEFLTALTMLDSTTDFSVHDYELICPSNFFQSAALLKESEYDVFKYKGKLFIANTDTRESQNYFMSYIGIRFEDLITLGPNAPPTKNNTSSYNSIVETEVAGMKCIYTCEIDSFNPNNYSSRNELIQDTDYTEIKMILSKKIPPHSSKNQDILKILRKGNNNFEDFLYRLNVQCRFGNNHNVLIGVRDSSFNIRLVREFSLKNDIERCFKTLRNPLPPGIQYKYAVGGYDGYLRSLDYIEGILNLIKRAIDDGNPVCKVRIRASEIDVVPIQSLVEREKIIKKVLIKEFRNRL